MLRALILLVATTAMCGGLHAHPVPSITIEAEFGSKREVVIKVNLDPRLFLEAVPTAVPPVPASWWFEQDDAAKEKTKLDAAAYVERSFAFTVGTTPLKGAWQVQPIDSVSAFPLGQASMEAHMLVEHHGTLPDAPGDFKVAIAKDCAVAILLLCSNIGEAERRPQSLFPGENSRAFPLPPLPAKPAPENAAVPAQSSSIFALLGSITLPSSRHFIGDHLILAVLLGVALRHQLWRAVLPLAAFHTADLLGASLAMSGWMPFAPLWMHIVYWVAFALIIFHLFVLKSNAASILSTISVAGWCHGMDVPHLHLSPGAAFPIALRQTGLLFAAELIVLLAAAFLVRLSPGSHRNKVTAEVTRL
jgi:hypothetical protein